jgi:NAD(P)H dehydrogenase (quinone)
LSANVAVIYCSEEVREVAEAFAEPAGHVAGGVRLLRVGEASNDDLVWADGIGFGTAVRPGRASDTLMGFIAQTEPLWDDAQLFDKVVSIFTDEPEHFAPDSVVHPIYEALYQWGAVIIGPRAFELAFDARPRPEDESRVASLCGPRLRTARYRGRRMAALAPVLASERARCARLEL